MIAYDELAAALERWRIRNGLPANPPLFTEARGSSPPPPPGARPTQSIAAAPPPPGAIAPPARTPPPPPSGRATLFGMPAATVVAPPPTATIGAAATTVVPPLDDLGEADVLEESGDPYDNEGSDFAVGFGSTAAGALGEADGEEATRAGAGAASSGDRWPVEADDEATHIGDPARRN